MNTRKDLFLDTATQIARHWHSLPVCEEIQQQLGGCKLFCSRYVKCQYKATLLASIIKLHNLLVRSQNILEAIQKATEARYSKEAGGKLTPGVLVLIVDIAYWVWRQYNDYDEQVERLRDLIEDGWETFFYENIEKPLIDETNCAYADEDPAIGDSGLYRPIKVSCTQEKPPECGIQEFWNNHCKELEILAKININSVEAKPKDKNELQNVKEHAGKITQGESPYGRRCTVYLSDAVVCLESTHCPEPVAVHSINKKHFRPLGEVLDIECEPKDK